MTMTKTNQIHEFDCEISSVDEFVKRLKDEEDETEI